MTSHIVNIAVDCADAYGLARFWSEVTGHPLHPEDRPGDPEVRVLLPEGPILHFNQVPEPKTVKNRLHLCLRPETSREAETERLLALGVLTRRVVYAADGWLACECGVAAVVVVGVEEFCQGLGALVV